MIYPATNQYIKLATDIIDQGGIIVYPTDTLYGFGVDATNSDAILKLNQLKARTQPLSIVLESFEKIDRYAILDDKITSKIKTLFPGPYTALLKAKSNNLSNYVQNGSQLIGIRIPDHFFPIDIVKCFRKPIITTSINRHGKEPLNDVTSVEIDFPNIDIFEDKKHKQSKGSTIIDFSGSPYKVIRQGDGQFPL